MTEHLIKLSAERCVDFEVGNTINTANIFSGDCCFDVNVLYFTRFKRIPNIVKLHRIDCKKANDWFIQNYQDSIEDCCYIERNGYKRKGVFLEYIYYFLFDDIMVFFDCDDSDIKILYRKTDYAEVSKIVSEILKFKIKGGRKKPEIELIVRSSSGLTTKTLEITRPKFSIEENYNDDLLPFHQTILNRLRKKDDKGLVLLHGKPGTGKTYYIRYLITMTGKPVIFLPPNMAASITDPDLMNVLIRYSNSIFVIEDAENIIIDRNHNSSSSVSTLLNIADGLLSDCLNIQIICSFNTDLSRVDSALIRKGRLIAKYEFLELDVPKAQALSNKLGFSSDIASPMTLAAVYNQHEMEFSATSKRKNSVGFKNKKI